MKSITEHLRFTLTYVQIQTRLRPSNKAEGKQRDERGKFFREISKRT